MPITINKEQGLYVIPCGEGYSCLGFDVAFKRALAYNNEMFDRGLINKAAWDALAPAREAVGTEAGYAQYQAIVDKAREVNRETKARLDAELTPELRGLEGRRVKVVDCYGDTRMFIVGKSSGFIPCHLELKSSRSSGGEAVFGAPFKSVRLVP